jgi:hypothetical protein
MKKTARIVFSILASQRFLAVSFCLGFFVLSIPVCETLAAWRGTGEIPGHF